MRPRPVRSSPASRPVVIRPSSGGISILGWGVILAGAALSSGILWYSRQDRMERRLTSLGGEVYYSRSERATLLAQRLNETTTGQVAASAPQIVDKLFGQLVAVHFGRAADLSGTDPEAVVKAIGEMPHLRTVVIDGVPLRDPHLLRLAEAPALVELGLKKTDVTAEGVAAARAKRPGLDIKWGGEGQ
ncbi:MAG: hypothetical protein ACKV19_23610 [Verrucomicrobiales bacterium]